MLGLVLSNLDSGLSNQGVVSKKWLCNSTTTITTLLRLLEGLERKVWQKQTTPAHRQKCVLNDVPQTQMCNTHNGFAQTTSLLSKPQQFSKHFCAPRRPRGNSQAEMDSQR
eukprot:14470833-Heterocapsa_arctica.AAC.1